jgi:hypothetical protein
MNRCIAANISTGNYYYYFTFAFGKGILSCAAKGDS